MSITLTHPTRFVESIAPTSLPGPGPQWFGIAMGTGILASLLQLAEPTVHGAADLARAMLILAWLALAGLVLATAAGFAGTPGSLRASVTDVAVAPTWGMVPMAILSVGSATATVLPGVSLSTSTVGWRIDATMWTVGTLLGLCTAIGFTVVLLRGKAGTPTTVWGLALVPPMVSATTGAALAQRMSDVGSGTLSSLVVDVSVGCFVLALAIAPATFARCYHHHLRVAPPVGSASVSAWIPLGVVGQSGAAALKLSAVTGMWHATAVGYAIAMLILALPLGIWATRRTAIGFRDGMTFTPGWWAMTFPIGTVALCAHEVGAQTGSTVATAAGLAVLTMLCCTWFLCAAATFASTVHHQASTVHP